MRCEECGKGFEPKHRRGRFCSGRCRVAAWQKRKAVAARAPLERAVRDLVGRLEEVLAEAREALKWERENEKPGRVAGLFE